MLLGHTGEVKSVAISVDGDHIVTASSDCTIKCVGGCWDGGGGMLLAVLGSTCMRNVWDARPQWAM